MVILETEPEKVPASDDELLIRNKGIDIMTSVEQLCDKMLAERETVLDTRAALALRAYDQLMSEKTTQKSGIFRLETIYGAALLRLPSVESRRGGGFNFFTG